MHDGTTQVSPQVMPHTEPVAPLSPLGRLTRCVMNREMILCIFVYGWDKRSLRSQRETTVLVKETASAGKDCCCLLTTARCPP